MLVLIFSACTSEPVDLPEEDPGLPKEEEPIDLPSVQRRLENQQLISYEIGRASCRERVFALV
jgi:hypothetical protein